MTLMLNYINLLMIKLNNYKIDNELNIYKKQKFGKGVKKFLFIWYDKDTWTFNLEFILKFLTKFISKTILLKGIQNIEID